MRSRLIYGGVLAVLSFLALVFKGLERDAAEARQEADAARIETDALRAEVADARARVDTVVITATKIRTVYAGAREAYDSAPLDTTDLESVKSKLALADSALQEADKTIAAYSLVLDSQADLIRTQDLTILSLERENAALRRAVPTKGSVTMTRGKWLAVGLATGIAIGLSF